MLGKGIEMSKTKIAVLVGSVRENSLNRKLALALMKLAPAGFVFTMLEIGDLPLYNENDDVNQAPNVKCLKAEIEAADGLMILTPEYNRSISGVLKNAMDHASRPWGKNSFAGKPTSILGISIGLMGTAMAQQHLRNILSVLNVPVLTLPEVYLQYSDSLFTESGEIGAGSKEFLQFWMDSFAAWVKRFN